MGLFNKLFKPQWMSEIEHQAKQAVTEVDDPEPLRRIMSFSRIFEVSLVTNPAYEGTSVQAASEGETLDSAHASLESAMKREEEERAAEAEQERRRAALERLENLQKEVRDHEV